MLNFVIAECHICAVSIIANAPLYSRNRRDRAADMYANEMSFWGRKKEGSTL